MPALLWTKYPYAGHVLKPSSPVFWVTSNQTWQWPAGPPPSLSSLQGPLHLPPVPAWSSMMVMFRCRMGKTWRASPVRVRRWLPEQRGREEGVRGAAGDTAPVAQPWSCCSSATNLSLSPSLALSFLTIDPPLSLEISVFLVFIMLRLQRVILSLGVSWGFRCKSPIFKAVPWRYLPGLRGDNSLPKAGPG